MSQARLSEILEHAENGDSNVELVMDAYMQADEDRADLLTEVDRLQGVLEYILDRCKNGGGDVHIWDLVEDTLKES